MNTKLIKQLESVGFERTENSRISFLAKVIKGKTFKYNYRTNNFWLANDTTEVDIWEPSFKQIVAAVKEHTGVDLQPKPTKTERITELENQVEELRAKQQGFEDLLKALNEKVSESEVLETPTPKVELEHAPKELKFSGWAEVIGITVVTHGFEIGQKVLVFRAGETYTWCSDGHFCCLVANTDLKPL